MSHRENAYLLELNPGGSCKNFLPAIFRLRYSSKVANLWKQTLVAQRNILGTQGHATVLPSCKAG